MSNGPPMGYKIATMFKKSLNTLRIKISTYKIWIKDIQIADILSLHFEQLLFFECCNNVENPDTCLKGV